MFLKLPFFISILLFSCVLYSCQDGNVSFDFDKKQTDQSFKDSQKIEDCLDKAFDNGWDKGFDDGWNKGFDNGWESRGSQLPNIFYREGVDFKGLKGVQQISVYIQREHKELDFDGLCRNKIESALRSLGVEIVDEFVGINSSILHLRYRVVKLENTYAMRASMDLFKRVLFVEERKKGDNDHDYIFTEGIATCWKEPCETLNLNAPNPKTALIEYLQENMDAFTNDWLKENPKS